MDAIDTTMAKLNEVFQAASQEMYQAQQQNGAAEGADAGASAEGASDEEVTDVDFEEVDEAEAKTEDKK